MIILELRQQIEVDTPKGRGRLFLVTEYGSEIEKIFTVILYNGQIWEFTNDVIRATPNITMGRKNEVWLCIGRSGGIVGGYQHKIKQYRNAFGDDIDSTWLGCLHEKEKI